MRELLALAGDGQLTVDRKYIAHRRGPQGHRQGVVLGRPRYVGIAPLGPEGSARAR